MNADRDFTKCLSLVRKKYKAQITLTSLLLFITTSLAVFNLFNFFSLIYSKTILIYWVVYSAFLAGLLGGLIFYFFNRKSVYQNLVSLDHRFRLQERLSTAYHQQLKGSSPFSALLEQDAVRKFDSIKDGRLFPVNYLKFLSIISTLLILLVISLNFNNDEEILNEDFKEIAATLQEKIDSKIGLGNDKESEKLKEKARQTANTLKDVATSQQKAKRELQELLKSITAEKNQLTNKILKQFTPGEAPENPEDPMSLDQTSANPNLQNLIKKLSEAFNNSIPQSIQDELDRSSTLQDLEDYLEQTIEELEKGDNSPNPPGTKPTQKKKKPQDLTKNPEQNNSGEGNKDRDGELKKSEKPNPESPGVAAETDGPQHKKDKEDVQIFTQAGKSDSDWESQRPKDIEKSNSPIVRQEGKTGEGEWFKAHVRSLTAIGQVSENVEIIEKKYRDDLKTAIENEKIPRNYREYIKTYFLSLGANIQTSKEHP